MANKILILDFGSQYTQLIARKIREIGVYCEIHPFNHYPDPSNYKGVILSGSPYSVNDADAPQIDIDSLRVRPVLGICYGAQWLASHYGGKVEKAGTSEYGRAQLNVCQFPHDATSNDPKVESTQNRIGTTKENIDPLLKGLNQNSVVWMSHGDTITTLPSNALVIASTSDVQNAAFRFEGEQIWGIQFHPEVHHSVQGKELLANFVLDICKCSADWTPESFISSTVKELQEIIGLENVILGLSGGVDSSVAALLLHKAVGSQLHCIFVNSGLLRKNEFEEVLESYKGMGLNVQGVDASELFLSKLAGVTDPEAKRKTIGRVFVEVFNQQASKIENAGFLAQGTIYPDVIESASVKGPSATIKSHHNVGGLPEDMKLKVVEPLRLLFKDEVRKVGAALGLDPKILNRHPFPGPGLGIRILGEVTLEKVKILQEADAIFINKLHQYNLYSSVWQAGSILLPVQSVGVMGDSRSYESTLALRAVSSVDGMTADWVHLPYEFLADVSNEIIRKVRGINRVVYDISSKPPATIEWE